MIEPSHLLKYVIRPVLKDLGLWSVPAEQLVLGTACQESECGRWLHQLGAGPALGIYQMEPATHNDIWDNFLEYKPDLVEKLKRFHINLAEDTECELMGNLYYATAMCRVNYLRMPGAIPDYLGGQAQYWKTFWNTELGAGTIQEYIDNWNRFVKPGVV